jgi:hypothetical protein
MTEGNVGKAPESPLYRGFLFYLAFPPMLLLLFGRPVWLSGVDGDCRGADGEKLTQVVASKPRG